MDTSLNLALDALLAASLASAPLPPLINADQAADLLGCSKEHLEGMADRGELPATKYGRGWLFVSAQLVLHVAHDCAKNVRPADAAPRIRRRGNGKSGTGERSAEQSPSAAGAALALEARALKRGRGRPRRSVPDLPPQT